MIGNGIGLHTLKSIYADWPIVVENFVCTAADLNYLYIPELESQMFRTNSQQISTSHSNDISSLCE